MKDLEELDPSVQVVVSLFACLFITLLICLPTALYIANCWQKRQRKAQERRVKPIAENCFPVSPSSAHGSECDRHLLDLENQQEEPQSQTSRAKPDEICDVPLREDPAAADLREAIDQNAADMGDTTLCHVDTVEEPQDIVPPKPPEAACDQPRDCEECIDVEKQTTPVAAQQDSPNELLRSKTVKFQEILAEICEADPYSEKLADAARRARIDTVVFHKVLDEVAPISDQQDHGSDQANSNIVQRQLSHSGPAIDAPDLELSAQPHDQAADRLPDGSSLEDAWSEGVVANKVLLQNTTASFQSALQEYLDSPVDSEEFKLKANLVRDKSKEFYRILDEFAPLGNIEGHEARTVVEPSGVHRSQSWNLEYPRVQPKLTSAKSMAKTAESNRRTQDSTS